MGEIRLLVPTSLQFFLSSAARTNDLRVAQDATSTIGHVIESVGVPLTEVGAILENGADVPVSQRLPVGSVVELRPTTRPERVPGELRGFVLDAHLGTLARRLRVLGVDTSYHNDAHDADLVERANAQRRVLLTRDRRLLMRRALWRGAYVRGDRPDDQLADVLDRFAPALRPWTRCTACNGELRPVSKDDVAHLLQPGTRRTYTAFAQCQACGKVYWRGAHSGSLERVVANARHMRESHI